MARISTCKPMAVVSLKAAESTTRSERTNSTAARSKVSIAILALWVPLSPRPVHQSQNLTPPKDLVTWTFVNELLTLQASGDLGPDRVVERPHVLYNSANEQWVMWMHIDNATYGEARAGVATSSAANGICGDYDYL